MDVDNNILTLFFDRDRKCKIFNPCDVVRIGTRFTIKSADKIVWEFYDCSKPQSPETLCVGEYAFIDKKHIHAKWGWLNSDEIFNPKGKAAMSMD